MNIDDADLENDRANYVMAELETGARPDGVVAQADYPCGCKAVRVSTAAGWQWVLDKNCADDTHLARSRN
jgi:hypothetical protein